MMLSYSPTWVKERAASRMCETKHDSVPLPRLASTGRSLSLVPRSPASLVPSTFCRSLLQCQLGPQHMRSHPSRFDKRLGKKMQAWTERYGPTELATAHFFRTSSTSPHKSCVRQMSESWLAKFPKQHAPPLLAWAPGAFLFRCCFVISLMYLLFICIVCVVYVRNMCISIYLSLSLYIYIF